MNTIHNIMGCTKLATPNSDFWKVTMNNQADFENVDFVATVLGIQMVLIPQLVLQSESTANKNPTLRALRYFERTSRILMFVAILVQAAT